MNDANCKWMLIGGLWLAVAALPAQAQDQPLPQSSPALSEQLVPPPVVVADSTNSAVKAAPAMNSELNSTVRLPTSEPGALVRWHRRCVARAQDRYWGYPEEFQDAPLGLMVRSHMSASVAYGHAARMVLYQYDFVPGTDQLKPRGKAQAAKISAWLSMNQFPVLVEPSGISAGMDDARRQAVWRELAVGPCPAPFERVMVGYPASRGLEGLEALAVDRNRVNQTVARGAGSGAAAISDGGGAMTSGSTGR